MPRDIPIANGNLLLTFDSRYTLRDVYFPYVGQENHTRGQACRFGIWVDGQMSWIHEPSWQKHLKYENETLVTEVTAVHWGLGIQLVCRDCVDFDRDLYVRKVEIENLLPMPRDVRLFWHHDFNIWASSEGNTAYYAPNLQAMIHYKGKCWILTNVCVGEGETQEYGVHHYAVGVSRAHGAEGTWRDAEDGVLEMNPIAQGSVDSTIGAHVSLQRSAVVYYWMGVAEDYAGVKLIDQLVRERGPEFFQHRVRTYWNRWVNKDNIPYGDLPDPLITLYKQSLLILRTQIDNRGAIIAANDSDYLDFNNDTYSYMWPRDGALVAFALDLAGQQDVTRPFYQFCKDVLLPEGCLLHKYNPDKSLGSSWHPWTDREGHSQLPIQEDETALVIWALWEHYEHFRDVEFIRPLYSPLIRRAGEFLTSYREPHTGLPAESYDLWEERHGIHTFTVAAVWAGLDAAAKFAETFGDEVRGDRFRVARDEIKEATLKHLWDADRRRFVRRLTVDRQTGTLDADVTIDSSLYGVFQFGMLAADDPMVVSTMKQIEERLWCRTDIGGLARYENDYYHQISQDVSNVPGNPWIICTLWLAEWYIAKAKNPADLGRALELLEWVRKHTLESGVLAEQLHPYSGDPISVSPLTWSHATVVMTVRQYLAKMEELYESAAKQALLSGDMDLYEMADWKRGVVGDLPVYQSTTLAWLPGVVQGFTTRHGGVSLPPYQSLNLGTHVDDDPIAVETNRTRLWDELGFHPVQVALAEQVHGNDVAVLREGRPGTSMGVDALVTDRTDLLLMLLFADCVPVYIVDPLTRAIGLAHSGWRGTVAGVTGRVVQAMRVNFGSRPESCLAAIGPSIGGDSYEVGQEVVDQFRFLETFRSANAVLPKNEFIGTYTLNLRQVIYSQLLTLGFRAEYVSVSSADTFRNRRDFFSFRRDGRSTGRMAGYLGLRSL